MMIEPKKTNFQMLAKKLEEELKKDFDVDIQSRLIVIARIIETKQDFLTFLDIVLYNFDTLSVGWVNQDLYSYMEALHAYSSSIEGHHIHEGIDSESEPKWRLSQS